MNIKILGSGCRNCEKLEKNTRQALEELNIEAQIEKVTDMKEILAYGLMQTPGLVIDEKVKLAGKVGSVKEIKNILKS